MQEKSVLFLTMVDWLLVFFNMACAATQTNWAYHFNIHHMKSSLESPSEPNKSLASIISQHLFHNWAANVNWAAYQAINYSV